MLVITLVILVGFRRVVFDSIYFKVIDSSVGTSTRNYLHLKIFFRLKSWAAHSDHENPRINYPSCSYYCLMNSFLAGFWWVSFFSIFQVSRNEVWSHPKITRSLLRSSCLPRLMSRLNVQSESLPPFAHSGEDINRTGNGHAYYYLFSKKAQITLQKWVHC